VDVGRALTQNWVMSVIYEATGRFRVEQGAISSGEGLSREAIKKCLDLARSFAPNSDGLVFLRDGDMPLNERRTLVDALRAYPQYQVVALVEVKKDTPHRIFRKSERIVKKPFSGDYYLLDDQTIVLSTTGKDGGVGGTPRPLTLKVTVLMGNVNTQSVALDAYKLCHLNYGSPRKRYSLPAPLKIADELAYELSLGVRRHGTPF